MLLATTHVDNALGRVEVIAYFAQLMLRGPLVAVNAFVTKVIMMIIRLNRVQSVM